MVLRCVAILFCGPFTWPNFYAQIEVSGGRFTSQSRPTEIGLWFKYGRPVEDRTIENLDAWVDSWWGWWRKLVPNRTVHRGTPAASVNADDFTWGCINNTTSCGLVLIMVSLSWWGLRVIRAGVGSAKVQEWRDAVAEVRFALTELGKLKDANAEEEDDRENDERPPSPKRKRV